ncbi:MAG: hypothetical protein KJ904_13970 [Alphaproteobacteria bacterium]|nr:hypothetical protein [Alphaproteobacteria bacterium]MBU0796711.1 hypothetical protein [Alphaproteobacteria bacterium]MBU0888260.1 hypothetical protein [Alphaproteobacteria bacterium]MBU1811461.1 hypothetical protein [Alphaproteobacteria bacterium]MBU2090471.1 hypothetical protein [Alphaproteobacteria bacterium]
MGALLVLLAACAQPTAYQPRQQGSSTGFSEQQIEGNRYRITFVGNQVTNRETVENYMLYRAAELTLLNEGDHFVMVDKDIERDTQYYTSYDPWPGSYGMYGSRRRHSGFGYGMGYGMSYSPQTYAQSRYQGYADILLYKGQAPKDDPKSFDARQVIQNLGPVVQRPQQPRG